MRKGKLPSVLLVGCVMVSLLVWLGSPAMSKQRGSRDCPRFKPVEPNSASEHSGDVPKTEVITVSDTATQEDPLVKELDFGVSVWGISPTGEMMPLVDDTQFFNLQVDTKRAVVALSARLEWDSPGQLEDLDAFLYDSKGKELSASDTGTGPVEPEEMVSHAARNCDGFTVEARPYRTVPRSATLEIWLSGRS